MLIQWSEWNEEEEDNVDAPLAAQGRESQDARLDRSGITPRGEPLAGAAAVTRGIVAQWNLSREISGADDRGLILHTEEGPPDERIALVGRHAASKSKSFQLDL